MLWPTVKNIPKHFLMIQLSTYYLSPVMSELYIYSSENKYRKGIFDSIARANLYTFSLRQLKINYAIMAEFACGIEYYFLLCFKRFFWSPCTITRLSVSLFILFICLFNEGFGHLSDGVFGWPAEVSF
jgi:hypothetical protein